MTVPVGGIKISVILRYFDMCYWWRTSPSPFVGTSYYCGSGAADVLNASAYYFNDPLWDRPGCITSNSCATPTQSWFYQQLSGTTTSNIEARIYALNDFARGSPMIDNRSCTFNNITLSAT